ncbi:MAG: hypothetical protein ABJ277_05780, partial [Flavobacteriaceae bacterium]
KLMKTILDVKKTVTQYVWFNLIIFAITMIISIYSIFIYGPESNKIMANVMQEHNEATFWFLAVLVCIIFTAIFLVLIWLFYKLLYGILLKRLRANYNELKKLEV